LRVSEGDDANSLLNPRVLILNHTKISNKGLKYLDKLSNLKHLGLYSTNISDSGLGYIKKLVNLKGLDLCGTSITASGLWKIADIKGLEKLSLPSHITKAAISKLESLLPECDIMQ